ncbi:MAG: hypothetical protein FWF90_13270 [Promicromonosporaceae bacterium]|nr:hypothetical protein [Promicromonosporaceae bacterium]
MRRLAAVVLVALGLVVLGPALAANAAPVVQAGPLATKACAAAPEPSSPLSGLPGMLYPKPRTASDADPFHNPGVTIADVYGYNYQWVDYDNGCIPGADALPKLQTGVGNFLMSGSAAVSAFTHSLLGLVVTPDFMAPLDGVLTSATSAIKGGLWDPWVTAILILVAAGVLVAASRSEMSSAVTTVGWALIVLVGATYVMSYPVASAQAVDGLVQTTVTTSARGFGVNQKILGPPVPGATPRANPNGAQAAIDSMFDTLNRDTFYDSWLVGTLGSSDSATARKYGPDLFKASHLTWSEALKVRDDPAAGQTIVDAKKALWVKTAAAVEGEDSAAYQQLTGNNGRWDAAGTVVLRVGLMMPFLMVAAIFIVIAYVATRVFVPLAPGFGVVGLMFSAQGWVIAVLKQVGRFIILGPVFFVAALANLLLDNAVLSSTLAFALQLVIVAAIPFILFKLLRPGRAVPGARGARRMARSGLGTLVNAFATRKAVAGGVDDAKKKADDADAANLRRDAAPYRIAYGRNAPVAAGDTMALPVGLRPRELGAGALNYPELPRRTRREFALVGAPVSTDGANVGGAVRGLGAHTASSGEGLIAHGPAASPSTDVSRGSRASRLPSHPALRPDDGDLDLSAPADRNAAPQQLIDRGFTLPSGVHEASTTLDPDGNPVFEIWRPPAVEQGSTDESEGYR